MSGPNNLTNATGICETPVLSREAFSKTVYGMDSGEAYTFYLGLREGACGDTPEFVPLWKEIGITREEFMVRVFDGPDLPEPSPIPLPDTLGLMIGALCFLVIAALFRHSDDLENLR